ncbi:MAG: M3 family metallopeptidase [Gemmatimonadota bacterium]
MQPPALSHHADSSFNRDLARVAGLALLMAAFGCAASPEPGPGPADPASEPTADPVAAEPANPLLEEWDTPFAVPPFDRIRDEHYLPAFRAAMAEHDAEIQVIVEREAPPTFENTIEALERAGSAYARVSRVFGAVNAAHTNDALQEVARTLAPERAAHFDDIVLDPGLYDRVRAVWEQRDALDLTSEQEMLLEETHKQFVRAGAALEDDAKTRVREINAELAQLSQEFGENVLKETNRFELHVTDSADLGNLAPNLVQLAAQEARRRGHDRGWSFTLQPPSINPFLESSPDRELRRRIFMAYALRGDNDDEYDNKAIAARMAALRAERSDLMGYDTHAAFVLSDNMAETPARVFDFLDQVWEPALQVAKDERDALQEMMHQDGVAGELEPWDWRYYAEKVRKARYDLDQEALAPFFQVEAVRDGVFELAGRLWGLTFLERPELPRWHPTQQAFEVREADGSHVGILYLDYFTRESKRGGAWMNSLRPQHRMDGEVTPVVTVNFNFPPPAGDGPSLITFDNALTLAHEMGHGFHGLFSDVTYPSLSGTSVPRDFVEFPSQVIENWMGEEEMLRLYARHYRTGEPIAEDMIERIEAARQFNQGFATVEYMAAAYLDMAWHTLDRPIEPDTDAFEAAAMERIGLLDEIIPRYRSTYFNHVFAGGYSAGYYSYLWAEVLDADAYAAFGEAGDIFDRETARRLRAEVLARGGTRPGMELYRNFRGREPSIEALLEKRGLVVTP